MIRFTILSVDTATARELDAIGDQPHVAVVAVRPDTRRPAWLARDLLSSVGIRHDVSGHTRRDADDRQLSAVWMHAHDIHDVVVSDVEQLPAALLGELVELVTLAGADLWLVAGRTPPDALIDMLLRWPVRRCPPEEFLGRWLQPDDAPDTGSDPRHEAGVDDGLPAHVPSVDFPLFRATAGRQLTPDDAARVDELYVATFRSADAALESGTGPLQVLRDLLTASRSRTATTVIARATQAAALSHGHHLRIKLGALLVLDDHVQAAVLDQPSTWDDLHAYRQPERQATCALMIAGLPTDDQLALTVGDLDTEHLTVLTADGVCQLPEQAGPTLRAMAASRAAAGATSDEPLLARPDGSAVADRALANAVNAVQGETGLRLTPDHVRRAAEPLDAWARRRHVTAVELEV